jgi:hypothetical protein
LGLCGSDGTCVVGDDPLTLLTAARLVQDRCDAIDLNFGCPQGIARAGHYGAFLLEEPELIVRLVQTLARVGNTHPHCITLTPPATPRSAAVQPLSALSYLPLSVYSPCLFTYLPLSERAIPGHHLTPSALTLAGWLAG